MASKIKVDTLETANGSGTIALSNQLSGMTSASMPSGSVLQVVTSADISTQTTSTSTSFSDTGVTATITPTSTSSKIFAVASSSCMIKGTSYNVEAEHRVLRGSVEITAALTAYDYWSGGAPSQGLLLKANVHLSNLDSPATTSAVTYKIQHRVTGTNYSATTFFPASNSANIKKGCRITLIEIKG